MPKPPKAKPRAIKVKPHGLTLVRPTKQEILQMKELLQGHSWQLLYSDFLKRLRTFGFELCQSEAIDPGGRQVPLPYLKHEDGRIVVLPGGLEMEDQLDQFSTASLCRRAGVPPEDFGLQPEEPFDGDVDDFLKE